MNLEISIGGGSVKDIPGQVFDKELGRIGTITISTSGKRHFNFIHKDKKCFKLVDVTRIFYQPNFRDRLQNILNNLLFIE